MKRRAVNKLAKICAYSTDAPEWEEFVRMAMPVVALAAQRAAEVWEDFSQATVHEIVQEVFLELCQEERRILREFEDRGHESFLNLLRIVTARVGSDYFRRRTAGKRGGAIDRGTPRLRQAAHQLEDVHSTRAVETARMCAQLDGLLQLYPDRVSERDRRLFWLHYQQGMNPRAISLIPGIGLSARGVESALLRLTRLLRQAVLEGKPRAKPPLPAQVSIQGEIEGPPTLEAIK